MLSIRIDDPIDFHSSTLFSGGYVNFGYVFGTSGYGFRDNAGTLEFKNRGGAWAEVGYSGDPAVAHTILSAIHIDSTVGTVVRGDSIVGIGSTPKWTRLAIGTVGTVMGSDGTDLGFVNVLSSVPAGLTYTTTTRALSLTTGYMIPSGGDSGQVLTSNGTSAPSFKATSLVVHELLSATHNDSTAAAVTRGAVIVGVGSTPKWETKTIGAAGTALISDGTDTGFATILSSVPTGLTYTTSTRALSLTSNYFIPDNTYVGQTSITTLGTIGTGSWHATTIAEDHGGTGVTALSSITTLSGLTSVGTVTTGTWNAYKKTIVTNSGNNATIDLTATGNCYGQIYTNTGNDSSTHYDLPAAVVGMNATFYVKYAGTIVLHPYTGDQIMVVTSAANDTLTSDAVLGTFFSMASLVANTWDMTGMNGSWTES